MFGGHARLRRSSELVSAQFPLPRKASTAAANQQMARSLAASGCHVLLSLLIFARQPYYRYCSDDAYVWALLCARLPGWKVCVLRVLARIWQSASATWGETQGTCALDFAGGSAPRTPGIAQGVVLHSCALDFAGGVAPRPPRGALPAVVAILLLVL